MGKVINFYDEFKTRKGIGLKKYRESNNIIGYNTYEEWLEAEYKEYNRIMAEENCCDDDTDK